MSDQKNNQQKEIQEILRKRQVEKNLELRRKLINRQLDKIQNMSLSQIIERKRKGSIQPVPHQQSQLYIRRQMENSLDPSVYGRNGLVQNPVDKHIEMLKDTENRLKQIRRDMKVNPILSHVKRGKLGLDTLFIPFAIFGSLLLPFYFYQEMKQSKRKIVQNRGVAPQVIANLDEDSPISLDSISEQSIHYSNPQRDAQFKQRMKKADKMSQLRRQLDL